MRPQYHLRKSERGLLAWDVRKLVRLVEGLPVFELRLEEVRELDECFWFDAEGDRPTCRKVAEHAKLMLETDLGYPVILDPEGRVMDGMHRVCRALLEGRASVRAVRLEKLPEPDFVGVAAGDLAYGE